MDKCRMHKSVYKIHSLVDPVPEGKPGGELPGGWGKREEGISLTGVAEEGPNECAPALRPGRFIVFQSNVQHQADAGSLQH